jgi:hypothetical protein
MILAATVALSCSALGVGARAEITLNTPAGLNPGDQFRFLFITTAATLATSTSISDYDTFVNTDVANAGGATYNGISVTNWLVIGSTSTVAAINHIGQGNNRVYLVDGTEIALSTTTATGGLWSGQLMHAPDEHIDGTPRQDYVWTGTQLNGTASSLAELGNPYGKDAFTAVGSPGESSLGGWIYAGAAANNLNSLPLYGISPILTVPGAPGVPEPSTLLVSALGAVAFIAYGWSRNRTRPRQGAAGEVHVDVSAA